MKYSNDYKISMKKQSGITLVFFTAIFILFMMFAAFAFDVNHAMLNKTRFQNAVDAAALAGAVKASDGKSDEVARQAAIDTVAALFSAAGNTEVSETDEFVLVQFSNDPQDFSNAAIAAYDSDGDTYIRVSVSNVPLRSFIVSMFGISKVGAASAVAGPSSEITTACNVVPMAVCAGTGSTEDDVLGYEFGEIYALKVGDGSETSMTSGNYQLLDFGSGGNTVGEALAGGFTECVTFAEQITTQSQPGNVIGPVGKGLNTRFGDHDPQHTAEDYPSDLYIEEFIPTKTTNDDGSVTYSNDSDIEDYYEHYRTEAAKCNGTSSGNCTSGDPGRRILPVPMINCDEAKNGSTPLKIEAVGCFFMLKKAPTDNGDKEGVVGQFIEDCTIENGSTGIEPGDEGVYKIQLYKDPSSGES
ncbi:pilus assembly protein TadG-related protein [Vibrio sp. ZSDZ34]|uniref:Pilus assembly protein TadG-related protein n=1 Tax=Vibrio gelatinilyticus TaxID=2893468 RepID=A0A9X2AWC4_9VIBR|nr:pilus assembly protein TadG-related protein [Vibrio gelatinilyticus]MCJ2377111.1 pilus assembly protein TadG-related protein [Vibrio gelatinilyticus]